MFYQCLVGLIAISADGEVGHWATTERMVWASAELELGSGSNDHSPELKLDGGIDNGAAFRELV